MSGPPAFPESTGPGNGARGLDGTGDLYRSILEHSPEVTTVSDPDGRILYATPAIAALLGYDAAERIGRPLWELLHPDDAERYREQVEALMDRPDASMDAELRLLHRDGGVRHVRARSRNLVADPRVRGVVTHLRDVTPVREAVRERDEARRLLDRVISHAPVVLFMINREGEYELSEGRGLEPLGLKAGAVVGRNVFDVYAHAGEGLDLIRRGLAGEEVEGLTPVGDLVYHTMIAPVRGADGKVEGVLGVSFDVTEREAEAQRAAFQARLLDAVGESVIATDPTGVVTYWNNAAEKIYGWTAEEMVGRNVRLLTDPRPLQTGGKPVDLSHPPARWSGEYEVLRKDGRRIPVQVTAVTVEEDGKPMALVGVSRDLSEKRELEAQLRQAQKMEAVGCLAGGVAHDFNNLLTAIGGYAAVAAENTRDDQVAADIAEVVNATERARGLVDKLLAFSRRSQTAPRAVDLNAVVEGMVGMLRRMIGEQVRLETELSANLWPAHADPVQIEQAVVNLVVNARDAMPDGGTITVRTDRVVLDEARARRVSEGMTAGKYVRLTVSDTGVGIEPEVRDRIFEPFFTTKDVGRGSGLGLSIVFGEVTRVGGGVVVRSRPGEGATFSLYLPPSGDPVPTGTAAAPEGRATSAAVAGVILLVEDEAPVRALARRVLEREGYAVMEAESGVVAERVLAKSEVTPDLLLTDVIMPQMGGAELAERLAASRPGLRVLYMSGYTADELRSRGVDQTRANFLPKPFTPVQLREAVRRVIPR